MATLHLGELLEDRIAPAFAAVVELFNLNGTNGFKLSGVATYDVSGYPVSDAGDVNGDGFGDLIIGASRANANGADSGAAYVVFGKAGGFPTNLNLSLLNGSNGFKLSGEAANDRFGFAVSGGDVNGDGFDDLIVGARNAASYSGASYVIFGKATGFEANLNVSTVDGGNGFQLSGVAIGDYSGGALSVAGDVNGDGFDDVIIGGRGVDAGGRNSGASYVVFGKANGFAANLELSTLDGSNGFNLHGVAEDDVSGFSVSDAGDINGDGFDDVLIGAPGVDYNGATPGASYVVFGKADGFAANLLLSALDGSNGFRVTGGPGDNSVGFSVSTAGDINGDGFDDVIIGAPGQNFNVTGGGTSYVVFGNATGFAANLNLPALDGQNGFKISGVALGDRSGSTVSAAGDVNADGFGDLIIGAADADPNGEGSGASYVFFGKASGFGANLNLAILDGSNGFKLNGVARRDEGAVVSAAGDMNGDGFGDLIIGAPAADPGGLTDAGASYVVFGSSTAVLGITNGSVAEGDAGTKELAFTVSLSAASTVPISVHYATKNGTAQGGSDFMTISDQTLNFAPGETSKTITVQVLGDTMHEADERFGVALSAPTNGATIDDDPATGIGTILNDDASPVISIAGASVVEGDLGASNVVFTVSLSAASGLLASVSFASADETALAGSDYTALAPRTLTFAPGETTKTIAVDVLGDTEIEDHESFAVVLSAPTNASIIEAMASGTILNDDTALRIAGVSGLEGHSGSAPFVFTISLEKASAIPVTVTWQTVDGTAMAGSDYEAALPTQLTFAAGETSRTIAVEVLGDVEVEAHETFSVVLSGANGAIIAEGTATGTILNDDTLIRIDDASVLEGHSGTRTMTFTVSLSAGTALPVSVNFTSADGTATAGADYTALTPGTLNFAPGETSKTVTVEVLGDIAAEPSETFLVLLSEAGNAVIEDGTGTGTILDDDVTLVGTRKATFTDVDGDLVRIKVNKGTLKVEDFTLFPAGSGSQLALVDFSGETEFTGANLSISAKGGGAVDVGYINATGIDLGAVVVKGDLGQIDAGNAADADKAALRSLSANSLGMRGLETQLPGGSLTSDIVGALKKLKLANGMHDVTLSVSGDIGAVKIKGDVLGSAIRTDGKIGTMKIGGDLAASDLNAATLSARGNLSPTSSGKAITIANLSIGGSIDHAQILAGYDRTGTGTNADAGIGAVIVRGDWIASSLIAGVTAGPDGLFGTDDDASISPGGPIASRIASILIKGTASGTEGGVDHFGFVAEQIGAFKAGGNKLALTTGPSNDLAGLPVGVTGDLKAREVA